MKRVVFCGTPDFAATHLKAVIAASQQPNAGFELVGVYTQPDRPAGRGRKLQASPVKQLALEANLPVYQPLSLKDEAAQAELAALKPDLLLVVAYGLLLPQEVLDLPSLGCVNVHASLLPQWRGAAPIQRSLLAGQSTTGVSLMQMELGLDTGPVLATAEVAINAETTSASLHNQLAEVGSQCLVEHLPQLLAGELKAVAQDDSLSSYAHKLTKAEAQINWQLSATEIALAVRGYNPWPVAWFNLPEADTSQQEANQQQVRVWQAEALTAADVEAATNNESLATGKAGEVIAANAKQGLIVACGAGWLKITELQMPSKPKMPVADLLNGNPNAFLVGQVLAWVPHQPQKTAALALV